MTHLLSLWADAALTAAGFFWTAFWAFGLGYLISAVIQVLVSRDRMTRLLGRDSTRSVALATGFGVISSSCSFAALATTRSLIAKGAHFVPAMAFLLASTNLVIELGILIAIFLGWQFIVGEYVGGILLILIMWGLARLTLPQSLLDRVRERLEAGTTEKGRPLSHLVRRPKIWREIGETYLGEWRMVWRDVTVGFTLAGIIAVFVPPEAFAWLFPGTGSGEGYSLGQLVLHAVIGPVAAFFTFIGSMGNIPLAGVLFQSGVSMAGVMAFIFSDLVVLPVLRVNAAYYGWTLALYIAGLFLAALVVVAVAVHLGFAAAGLLPDATNVAARTDPADRFALDYTFWFNTAFLAASAALGWQAMKPQDGGGHHHHDHGSGGPVLTALALLSHGWLVGGLILAATL